MANDRIYIRCKTCKKTKLLAKFWGDRLGPIFETFEEEEGTAEGDLDAAHKWLTKHLLFCRNGRGMHLGMDCGFALVTEGELTELEKSELPSDPAQGVTPATSKDDQSNEEQDSGGLGSGALLQAGVLGSKAGQL